MIVEVPFSIRFSFVPHESGHRLFYILVFSLCGFAVIYNSILFGRNDEKNKNICKITIYFAPPSLPNTKDAEENQIQRIYFYLYGILFVLFCTQRTQATLHNIYFVALFCFVSFAFCLTSSIFFHRISDRFVVSLCTKHEAHLYLMNEK